MRNTVPMAYTAVPVTFAGMVVTMPESLRSRSPESSTKRRAPQHMPEPSRAEPDLGLGLGLGVWAAEGIFPMPNSRV